MIKNLYKELEVKENATQSEIKSSYRRLVKNITPMQEVKKIGFLQYKMHGRLLMILLKKNNMIKPYFH
tara:strand:+ start:991 stop:1194 length:204 start_codon:yes stop_codon:yes gene_type:complete